MAASFSQTNVHDEHRNQDASFAVQDSTNQTNSEVIEDLDETLSDANSYRLSFSQSLLVASIVEDAIVELRILENSNNKIRVQKTLDDTELLRAHKYGVKQLPHKDELDGVDSSNISSNTFKIKKLFSDRRLVRDTLKAMYLGIPQNLSWKVLDEKIQEMAGVYQHRNHVTEELAKNRITRRDLTRQLRQQRNHAKSVVYDTDMVIGHLRTTVEDSAIRAETRTRYTQYWEKARREQQVHTMMEVETPWSLLIETHKQRLDKEQRAHSEMERLIAICINETLSEIEYWMQKYDDDIEAIDLKIQIRRNEYEVALEERKKLEIMLKKHEELIKEWLNFKEEREKARAYREKMHKSACIIQAWWRGLLVRLQLGPYKVTKKHEKSAAGKKK